MNYYTVNGSMCECPRCVIARTKAQLEEFKGYRTLSASLVQEITDRHKDDKSSAEKQFELRQWLINPDSRPIPNNSRFASDSELKTRSASSSKEREREREREKSDAEKQVELRNMILNS